MSITDGTHASTVPLSGRATAVTTDARQVEIETEE